jgi:predicted ferric reductase
MAVRAAGHTVAAGTMSGQLRIPDATGVTADHSLRAAGSPANSALRAWVGPAILGAVAAGTVAVWLVAHPAGEPSGRYAGELFGVEAVLLFSCSLVLATLLPPIERAFGGLDRVAVWHRRVAVAGLALLVGHLALVTSPQDPYATSFGHALGDVALGGLVFLSLWALAPRLRAARWPGPVRRLARASYERWLTAHRLTGLFVAVAVAHGAIVDPSLRRSSLLRVVFIAIGVSGVGAYLYRELLARYVVAIHDYTVRAVEHVAPTVLAIQMEPARQALSFAPGQFVVVAFGGYDGWQRHPFSVSSPPSQRELEITIKAGGDYTGKLLERLRPGVRAKVAGPFGEFDYRRGGDRQVWIAGGIGVTPFLSWIRGIEEALDRDVHFFYSVAHAGDALHRDEIDAAAAAHHSLHVHYVYSATDGLLTAEGVMGVLPAGASPWIYMCGPSAMTRSLAKGFRRCGIPGRHIRSEDFGAR